MKMCRIITIILVLLVVGTFTFLKATEDTRATSKNFSEEVSVETSLEVSDELSEEFSKESSEEASGEISIEVSDEASKEAPIALPEGVDVGYIVYDITSDSITSCYNTNQEYRTGCTIKAAYVLYLLDSGTVSQKDMDTIRIPYKETAEGTSVLRNKGTKEGTPISLKTVLEYTIKYSDNDAYVMLVNEYAYSGFNQYIASIGSSVRLGSAETGYNFTSASAADQLIIWKQITQFCFPADGRTCHEAKVFIDWLFDGSYNFIEQAYPGLETLHMSGWANQSGTMNDCAIVLDEVGNPVKIVIILTSDGVPTEDLKIVHKPRFLKIAEKVIDTIIVL